MSSVSFYSAVSETLHASPPIANSCTLSISQYYLCKSCQIFLKFSFSPSPTSTEVCPLYTLHKHTSIIICFNSSLFPLIHIKICLISSSVLTTIMSALRILLDGHLWFCRPLLRGELQSSNPLTPRLSLFSHQLRAVEHIAISTTLYDAFL